MHQFGLIILIGALAVAPATQPSVDPALWARMIEIDARAGRINSLVGDFEQRKFTPLLRKPLLSTGRVRVKGATMRWDTEKPEKSVLFVTDKEVKIYYPAQASVEIYAIDQRLAELASSPLPRLAALKDRFSFMQIPVADMDKSADAAKFMALKLIPAQDELRQHVQDVKVLLEMAAGYIVQVELTDADGDRTVDRFVNVQLNGEVGDLELKTPPGTKISRPLEGLGNQPPPVRSK